MLQAGGEKRLGPIHDTGEGRSEKNGSVSTCTPRACRKKVAWPTNRACRGTEGVASAAKSTGAVRRGGKAVERSHSGSASVKKAHMFLSLWEPHSGGLQKPPPGRWWEREEAGAVGR